MIKRLIIVVLGVLLLFGCSSSKRMNQLKLGMTKAEVIEAIGPPKSTSATEDIVYLRYQLRYGSGFTSEYFVRLQEGRVDAFGRVGDFGLGF